MTGIYINGQDRAGGKMFGWFGGGTKENAEAPTFPEIPSPVTKEDFEKVSQNMEKEIIDHVSNIESYTFVQETEGVKVYEKIQPDSAVHLIIVVGSIDISAKQLAEGLWNPNLEKRQKWDNDLIEFQIKEEIADHLHIMYQVYSAPTPVAPREVVALRAFKEKDGAYTVWGGSINYASVKGFSNYVRAVAKVSGWMIQPEGANKAKVFHLVQVDPKGWIPPFVVNSTKTKPALRIIGLRKAAADGNL